jgi:hypothetical protein
MLIVFCIVAIVAAANTVWWLAGITLLGALILGTAQYLDDERRWNNDTERRRLLAEMARRDRVEP